MRKIKFVSGEFYHIYNRGVDKRAIFHTKYDLLRFLESMEEFNSVESVGSLYQQSIRRKQLGGRVTKRENLVNIICYCLNFNHFHLLLEQVADNGISEFMKRLSGGYSYYFNEKNKRTGALFQGRFKAVHADSNEYILKLSAYINLNHLVHANPQRKMSMSSWEEFVASNKPLCRKNIVLDQFKDGRAYENFAAASVEDTILLRKGDETLVKLLLE